MNHTEAVGLGALNMDNIYQVERILDDGEAVVKDLASFPGGSAANTVYGLAKLGLNTGFIGAVGDDAEARLLLQDLQKAGVDTGHIKTKSGERTGSTLCLSDELGRRSIYVMPGANTLLNINDLDLNYTNKAKWLHISSFVDDTQFQVLLELMDKLDTSVKVSFSPGALYAAKGIEALRSILARTDVLFVNQSEMRQLTDDDMTSGAEICLSQGCNVIVVTMDKGVIYRSIEAVCYIMSAENEYIIESAEDAPVPAVDTTGAGDAFAAGVLYGLLKEKSLRECGLLGEIMARFCIRETGARAGLPSLGELAQSYQERVGVPL